MSTSINEVGERYQGQQPPQMLLSSKLSRKHRIPSELRSQAASGMVSTKVGDRLGSPCDDSHLFYIANDDTEKNESGRKLCLYNIIFAISLTFILNEDIVLFGCFYNLQIYLMDQMTSTDHQTSNELTLTVLENSLKTQPQPSQSQLQSKQSVQKIIKKYQNRISEMVAMLQKQKKQSQQQKQQFKQLNDQLNTLLKKVNSKPKADEEKAVSLANRMQTVKKQLENQMKKNGILKKQIDQMKYKNKYLEGDKLETFRNQIKDKERVIEDLSAKIRLYEKMEKAERSSDAYKKEEELNQKIMQQNQQILHLKKKIAELKKIEENYQKYLKKQHQIQQREPKQNAAKQQTHSAVAKAKEKTDEQIVNPQVEKLTQKLKNLQSTRKTNQKNLRAQIENLNGKIKVFEKLINDASQEIHRKQKEMNILTYRLKEKERKNFNTLQPIQRLSKLRQSEQLIHSNLFEHRKQYKGLTHSIGNDRHFDDSQQLPIQKNYRIKKLTFSYFEEHILSLTTDYELQGKQKSTKQVQSFSIASSYSNIKTAEFVLSDYQYINDIEVYCGKFVEFLRFKTSREQVYEVGNEKNYTKCKLCKFEIKNNEKPIAFMGIIQNKKTSNSSQPKQFMISLGIQVRKKQVFLRAKYNPAKRAESVNKHTESVNRHASFMSSKGSKNDKNIIDPLASQNPE